MTVPTLKREQNRYTRNFYYVTQEQYIVENNTKRILKTALKVNNRGNVKVCLSFIESFVPETGETMFGVDSSERLKFEESWMNQSLEVPKTVMIEFYLILFERKWPTPEQVNLKAPGDYNELVYVGNKHRVPVNISNGAQQLPEGFASIVCEARFYNGRTDETVIPINY